MPDLRTYTVVEKDTAYRIPTVDSGNLAAVIHRIISELEIGGGVNILIKRES